jgi:hypothetical protein
MVEEFLEKAKVTACPECGHLQTPLNTEVYQTDLFGQNSLQCGSCSASWNVATGEVVYHGRSHRDKRADEAAPKTEDWEAQRAKEKAKRLEKDKEAQRVAPYVRSSYSPLEWLEALLNNVSEEDVVRVDLGRHDRWPDAGEPIIRIHLREGFELPFTGRIRAAGYTTGHRAQILLGPEATERTRFYAPARSASKVKALRKAVVKWEEENIGPVRARGEPVEPALSLLEKSVEEINRSIASSRKGRPENIPLMEWLERLREAEVAGKNRKGVVDVLENAIYRAGDRTEGR